ncbi:hypothetical protein HPB50_017472 [Hyalomma asiaticum]|uniref:Uncharacterized protein n=1 Tax=Hyalomma asiaticum TaxID=266040 RepID=A0ACB7RJ98_HYAAI|nr:hypothetical protein HPB50_017472 [Hyalomma asiaticum]
MTSSCASAIQKSAERVRDLLLSIKNVGQAVDSDLVFKEIKSDLKDSISAYLSTADDDGTALLVDALNECVRTVTTEFFQTTASDELVLVMNKCVNMYLGFSSYMMDKMSRPQLYLAALCSRIQALEVVALLLLKRTRYGDLDGYSKQLAEQIRCFKGFAAEDAKSDKEKLKARHAESVLQVCRFAAATATAANSEAALESLYAAKNACCDDFPMLQKYVSSRAYATGVQCFRSGHYKFSVSYFRESFCLGKNCTDLNRQAHTLYLLGSAYLLWDKKEHWEKAVNALDMAIWHHPGQLNYMTKKLEALYSSGNDKQLSSALDSILKHQDIAIMHVLAIHQQTKKHGYAQQAIEFLQRAYIRFSQDREALCLLVELLTAELDSDELDRASLTFQRILVQDDTKITQSTGQSLKKLFRYLFRFGCGKGDSGSTSEALVKEANRLERDHIAKKVSRALIYAGSNALKAGKMDITKDVLKQMASPPETNPALAELQLNCHHGTKWYATSNCEQNPNIYEEVSDCIEKAATILFVCENGSWHAEQSQWFATVCWNLALQPEATAEQQFHLLGHSFRLMLSVHGRRDTTKRITTYAIMATLSGVTASRRLAADAQLKRTILRDVHQIAEKLKEVNPGWRENKQLAVLLLTAEFEAIVHGEGAPNSKAVLGQVLSISGDNTELLEGFVAICQLVWMMTNVWNEGLQRYLEDALPSAKCYLNCALRIVEVLPTLKVAYQQRLLSRYQGLFDEEMDHQSATNEDPQ